MTLRLVSPDRKLFLMADEDDLKAVAELYKLTSKQKGNIRHCSAGLVWATAAATAMTALSAKRSENPQHLRLKHDDGTEYVPLVGKPQHMFDSVVTPRADMKFGSKEALRPGFSSTSCIVGEI